MKLVVGLGNIGKEYQNTRHNTGFYVLDNYLSIAEKDWKKKFDALYYEKRIEDEKVIFIKPTTLMNLSGKAVSSFANFYDISPEDILVICDDLAQVIGAFRLRSHGSCGGHNGLRNIEDSLQSDNYKRLRVGIKSEIYEHTDTVDFVLTKFSKEEKKVLDEVVIKLKEVLDDYFQLTFEELMSKYNRRG